MPTFKKNLSQFPQDLWKILRKPTGGYPDILLCASLCLSSRPVVNNLLPRRAWRKGTEIHGGILQCTSSFAKTSSSRLCASLTPLSIPACTIPSRSATDWNTDWIINLVRLPGRLSNFDVSSTVCPVSGRPSNSKVWMILSGAVTSWTTPWNPNSLPAASVWIYRYEPPFQGSNFSSLMVRSHGLSHCTISSGSVNALKTRSRGASNSLVMKISCLPGSAEIFV